jgi:hypothetical protein
LKHDDAGNDAALLEQKWGEEEIRTWDENRLDDRQRRKNG